MVDILHRVGIAAPVENVSPEWTNAEITFTHLARRGVGGEPRRVCIAVAIQCLL